MAYRFGITVFVFLGWMLLLSAILPGKSNAQIYPNTYRPDVQRMVLKTPHFSVIYPVGEESAALFAARILEDQYPMVQFLVGGSLRGFPVVLNSHNDRSNGFVTPINFRTEIEIPPIRGLSMNPRTGGWMETVAPHELVHALHLSNIPPNSFAGLINLVFPDLARSLHSAAPFGMLEGIAVFHESHVVYQQGGRGNYPYFLNKSRAALDGGNPWSLAQHLQPVRFSKPGDRHYAGGFYFINWIQNNYGPETTRRSIEFFIRYPFLGYGAALRHATGEPPRRLYRAYLEDAREETAALTENLGDRQDAIHIIETGFKQTEVRAPVWLDNNRVLFGASVQLNARPGFYVHDLSDGTTSILFETNQTSDFQHYFDAENRLLYFSRWHIHPWLSNTATADAYAFDVYGRSKKRLTKNVRLFNPFMLNGTLHGLQSHHETNQWVRVMEDGRTETVLSIYPDHIESIKPDPSGSGKLALLANRNGVQGIWLVTQDSERETVWGNPEIGFRDGSVLDMNWSRDGKRLYFSADPDGILQVYLYDVQERRVFLITDSRFNAFHPAESPDGNSLAYVLQQADGQVPAIIKKEKFLMQELFQADWQADLTNRMERDRLAAHLKLDSDGWESKPYRTGFSWLRPRGLLPITEAGEGFVGNRFGLTFEGTDVLSRHAYRLDVSTSNNRVWGDLYYRNTTFFPGYQAEAYYRPRDSASGLILERGAGFFVPITFRTHSNSRFSWISLRPGFNWREIKIDLNTVHPDDRDRFRTDWFRDPSLQGFAAYYHRVQQNIRDIQPNTGTVIYWQGEQYVGTDRTVNPSGMRFGINQYLSPYLRGNHGIMIGAEVITQTKIRVYGTNRLVYRGFGENVLAGLHNAGSLRLRYALPLWHIDDGWISVPLFFDRIYMMLQMNTVANLNRPIDGEFIQHTRSVFGAELRADMRFFNLPVNLGIGVGWEPTRSRWHGFGDWLVL